MVSNNPEVVLKIGDKLYPRRARLVTDGVEFELAFEALAAKYGFWREAKNNAEKRPPFVIINLGTPK